MSTRYVAVLLGLLLPGLAFAQSTVEPAHVEAAVRHLEASAFARGVPSAEVMAVDAVPGRAGTHVYLRQSVGGIGVAGTEATVTVGRDGRVAHVAGAERLTPAARAVSKAATPALSAADAAYAVARHNGFAVTVSGAARSATPDRAVTLRDAEGERVPARLVYAGTPLRLAWEVEVGGEDQLWLARVDAQTGAVLDQVDLVTHDTFGPAHAAPVGAPLAAAQDAPMGSLMAGSYTVFALPLEAPYYGSRSTVANPDDATASPFGWHDTNGAAGAEYTITRGNNVHAYQDANRTNSSSGDEPDGGSGLTFDFPLDLNQAPGTYRAASVTNLFYWNNVIHDVLYQYGFDEASGNFQTNTYGRGGAGGDYVQAEAQDGSGTNNANFSTPSDGGRPRMQMYIGTYPNPDVDGSFDNGVVIHEYGHGVSNRLTGGRTQAGCLGNAEQMGEGWSDWYGLMLTMDASDSGPQARGIGNYLFGYGANGGGIRLAPYSTSFGVNNYTYGRTTSMSAVHQIGFVWSTILWEVTWDMIDAHGFSADFYDGTGTAGNQIMLRLVTEGMKYQPCSPGFVSGRDGILAAEQAIYGGAYAATLQAAFARRGLGYSASQGSSTRNTDNVEAFDAWPGGGGNTAPTAAFSVSCTDLSCQFTDASSDADGTIASRAWTFGDGGSSTATNPSRTYGSAGTYTATLTVTDDGGATDQASQNVTVTTSGGNPIALTVATSTHRRKGNRADLSWSPADGGRVFVYRNGTQISRTRDDGSYRDSPSGNGPFTYQVCETDSGDCSNEETVSFLDAGDFAGSDGAVDTQVAVAPNPFTDETTIRFGLAAEGDVTLEVYNALGQRVAVLAEGFYAEGRHAATLDAAALPSGVYVYRLRTPEGVQTGRVLLAR